MKPIKDITIYDIAQQLNLSGATVSRALQDNPAISKTTRKKVQQTAAELGYRQNTFASKLRAQKSHTIGILLHELNSNFITSLLAGIEKVTAEAGYDIIITHSNESYEKEMNNASNLYKKRVDGVIASLSFATKNLDHFSIFQEKNIPILFVDRVDEEGDMTHVVIDNYKCGYLATNHLIEQGCKNIVLLTSSLKRNVYAKRHKGYEDALNDAKIPYSKNKVIIKDLTETAAISAAAEIANMNPLPDGIFVTNDFMAAVVMRELKKKRIKVPQDIAVVGFNNDAISKLIDPQLTTIDYPGISMGEVAASTLLNHLSGLHKMNNTNKIIVKSELVIRESSLKNKNK